MTKEEAIKLAEEVFNEEYSGLDKDSFLIGFQEAHNALTTLYKDKFELVNGNGHQLLRQCRHHQQ